MIVIVVCVARMNPSEIMMQLSDSASVHVTLLKVITVCGSCELLSSNMMSDSDRYNVIHDSFTNCQYSVFP